MKTLPTFSTALLLCLGASFGAEQDQPRPAPAADATTTATTNSLASTGIAMKDGVPWLIQNNQAQRLDASRLPDGQMLNCSGQLVPLPAQITGFDDAAGSATAPSATSASAATVDPATTGITLRGGTLFLVRDGKAMRIDTAALGANLMMTLDGRNIPLPENVSFDQSNKTDDKKGTVTPGTVTPGRVEGGNVRGGDVRGGDVRGGDVRGGDVRGGDVRGGDVRGGNTTGGSVRGGDVRGGNTTGGNTSR